LGRIWATADRPGASPSPQAPFRILPFGLVDPTSCLLLLAHSCPYLTCQHIFPEQKTRWQMSRWHAISVGNPRDVMRLAQHLVDKRVVRYQSGAWSLPDRIDGRDLASSIAQSMQESASALHTDARLLAQTFALSPEQQFTYEECLVLAGRCTPGKLVQMLDELAMADVVKRSSERCGLVQQAWAPILCGIFSPGQEQPLEQRLAEVFELRADAMRVGRHLLRAGLEQRAVDVLVEHARASQEQTDPNSESFAKLIEALPADWLESYGAALRVCARDQRPARQAFDLASRMAGIVSVTGTTDTFHLSDLLRQLEHDSGLDIYASLDPAMDPGARLQRTFELSVTIRPASTSVCSRPCLRSASSRAR
jgi:hypothetical protein